MADLHPQSEHADVAGYVLGTLEADEARAFAVHLAGCEACRTELDELSGLPALLGDVPAAEPLPSGLEERTFAAIEAAAAEGTRSPAGAAVPGADRAGRPDSLAAPAPPAGQIVPIGQARKARGRMPRLLAAAAAAVVVAAGVGVLVARGKGSPAPLGTVRLIAADGGPARGSAVVRRTPAGLTIDMTVQGLPATSPGTMETCWLVGPGDTLDHPNRVSVGSFVVPTNGATVHVHWTTAADLRRFPQLGVTREPLNGNPSHQGPKVLAQA
ncbi:MAG TPA: zf-HC2 domain-containing protein [Acidimicrobiales bacterium]|nr:zf-HC2 domain-containing protein [Acidimicrobiales bacterium]